MTTPGLLFVLPYFIHDKVIFCPDSSALLYRNIHKSKEEKLSVVERFQQHAGVKDVLLADIAYTQGVSGNLFCFLRL